eukprot:CAMPEP_0206139688 /NCGR_PEP_ID=MMETSP1473-20131121/7013_1 /ASSEMBLY_ACC=CAM_ASM_001109 /TAXON_ID=1461547 /ORGANISM="Stichococcus sp, Strain RCC1054" /LENGTH=1376 /DNA_ID=CAMNT_0053533577 /DNA_START=121 /DNA_END=4251 /DNA_ORIENTATION=-
MNGYGDSGGWHEAHAAPANPAFQEAITLVETDESHELIWAGTESGGVYALQCPTLKRYSNSRAHIGRVDELVAAHGGGALSLSSAAVKLHSPGGLARLTIQTDQTAPFLACALEPGSGQRAVIARRGKGLGVHELSSGRRVLLADALGQEVVIVRAPAGRGTLVAGTEDGQLLLLDPRTGYKVTSSMAAHSAGLAALDTKADLVVTAGYGGRQGRIMLESHVKVYDVRMTARMLAMLPFTAGPAILRFHPMFSSTVLVASASGIFSLADAQGAGRYSQSYQVDTAGDSLTSAALASTGDAIVFGGTGGYVHLWALSGHPRMNAYSEPLELPLAMPQPAVQLKERDSFALAHQYFPEQGKLLSDFDPTTPMQQGLPPRIVDPLLLANSRKADFVQYIQNPHFSKDAPFGQATAKIAVARNARVKVATGAPDSAAKAKAARRKARAAQGGAVLPAWYQHNRIKQQAGTRFEAFDFSAHNRTRYAGLENDMANSYANPLWQILYFIPALRETMMRHVAEPDKEFCLSCELGFLFRMLFAAKGAACQATNLLRALRQNREAGALGLLEGQAQRSSALGDVLVNASRDASLRRRVQSLQRFMLQQLHRESAPADSGSAKAAKATEKASDVQPEAGSDPAAPSTAVEALFGMATRQRTVCLSGEDRAERFTDSRTFQVELQVPVAPTPTFPAAAASPTRGKAPAPAQPPPPLPSFAKLLQDSIVGQRTNRGWFDDSRRYQLLQQSQVPTRLPQVLVISCGMPSGGALPWDAPPDSAGLPWALDIRADPDSWEVTIQEGAAAELRETVDVEGGPSDRRAVYELCAAVHHVQDADEEPGRASASEGHLIAHIQVPPAYIDTERGVAQSPVPPSPGQSPFVRGALSTRGVPPAAARHAAASVAAAQRPEVQAPAVEVAASAAAEAAPPGGSGAVSPAAAAEGPVPVVAREPAGPPGEDGADPADATAAGQAAEGGHQKFPSTADSADTTAAEAGEPSGNSASKDSGEQPQQPDDSADSDQTSEAPSTPLQQLKASTSLSRAMGGLSLNAARQSSFEVSDPDALQPRQPRRPPPAPRWMVFNDFLIKETPAEEVQALFGGQKTPCLLYYTQMGAAGAAVVEPVWQPPPVLMPAAFQQLCLAPPLQGPTFRLDRPTFTVLRDNELPKPGMVFGIDAEFVALAHADKVLQSGGDMETRVARLGLARVSVVRGEGPMAGQACVDDYIHLHEPVADYLTRFSGIVAGDLDLAQSRKYLTTCKRTYLKLRHLVDAGCLLVGHGLKKDFRMINIVVPPAQVVDTAELFSFKRQRKLSLRFLAAFLLRIDIQGQAHDSIEDACTALALHKVYQRLQATGDEAAKEALSKMYDFGQEVGWDPALWPRTPPPVFP